MDASIPDIGSKRYNESNGATQILENVIDGRKEK